MRLNQDNKKNQNGCHNDISSVSNGLSAFRYTTLACAVTAVLVAGAAANYAVADDYFNPQALSVVDGQNIADIESLEQFASPGGQMAGTYHVDIIVNNNTVDATDLTFIHNEGETQLTPVLTKADLIAWGVKADTIPALASLPESQEITNISDYIPDAKSSVDLPKQTLTLSVPQIAMEQRVAGTIPSSQWDNGITALVLNYYYSGSNSHSRNGSDEF